MLDSRSYPTLLTPVADGTSHGHFDALHPVRALLLKPSAVPDELPALAEILAAAIALALGERRKVIVPVAGEPAEFAFVRHGHLLRVSHYATGVVPEINFLDREVTLESLLNACGQAALCHAQATAGAERDAWTKLAERAAATRVIEPAEQAPESTLCSGGIKHADKRLALGFGFRVKFTPGAHMATDAHAFADVHALLFEGELWAVTRGKRIALAAGPIMLIAQRMVAAVEALVEATRVGRRLNVRLRSGDFVVGMRLGRDGQVALTLGPLDRAAFTLPALDPASAGLPILRLASDLTRAVIAADRAQARNLRLKELRAHVRRLRQALRSPDLRTSFQNRDPERLRLALPETQPTTAPCAGAEPHRLRFSERWAVEVDGLEAHSTFLCGDRVVVATSTRVLALSRDTGELLWLHPTERATSAMVGTVLVRMCDQGAVELRDVRDGLVFARTQIAPRAGMAPQALFAGGGPLPPMAIVQEQPDCLVAIDLRTGETRWRFHARGRGPLRVQRSGRVLVVVGSDGGVDALDVASGEGVWRYAERARFDRGVVVCRDAVILLSSGALSGGEENDHGSISAVDLYAGAPLWQQTLSACAAAAPVTADGLVVVPMTGPAHSSLLALNARDGRLAWQCDDPGLTEGGAAMAVDRALVINAPTGQVTAIHLTDGATLWQRALANAISDDVPRQLEPVLRNGALFTPSAQVHVLRPSDGTSIAAIGACDLVPDLLRVDERGWLYVAEESGHLRGYAPAPHLRLVKPE